MCVCARCVYNIYIGSSGSGSSLNWKAREFPNSLTGLRCSDAGIVMLREGEGGSLSLSLGIIAAWTLVADPFSVPDHRQRPIRQIDLSLALARGRRIPLLVEASSGNYAKKATLHSPGSLSQLFGFREIFFTESEFNWSRIIVKISI